MGQYSFQKRPARPAQTAQPSAADLPRVGAGLPNSVLSAMLGVPDTGLPDLEERMRVRTQALRRQIPAAEQEADRLSAGVTSGSMEEVRAEMGRRLDADFSGVRLHTDAAAADRADKMGAAAYTSGQDIYFGSGGFQPDTAAHELVHTVQQGAVPGGPAVQSVPMGTVQMKPVDDDFKRIMTMVNGWREQTDGPDKALMEITVMNAISNYFSTYGKSDKKNAIKNCANLENILLEIAQKDGRQEQAENNIAIMNLTMDTTTNSSIDPTGARAAMTLLKQGVHSGNLAGGKKMSPALQAILTETMAGQDKDTTARTSAQPGTHITGPTSSRLHVSSSSDTIQDAAGIFHESTHAQNYKLYGSVLSAPASEVKFRSKMKPREQVRLQEYRELEDAGIKEFSTLDRMGIGQTKLPYGRHGEPNTVNYMTSAANGFLGESESLAENDPLKDILEQQARDLTVYSRFHSRKNEYNPFSSSSTAIMSEEDPTLNEMMYRYESHSDKNMRKDSQFYRTLKAAAIRAHAERHNEALRKKHNL